jgi:hypothetical protein
MTSWDDIFTLPPELLSVWWIHNTKPDNQKKLIFLKLIESVIRVSEDYNSVYRFEDSVP